MLSEEMSLAEEYGACYFHDDDAEEFYEDSLSKDLFKKFQLELLTPPQSPPQSPPHNPFPPDRQTSVDKRLQMVSQILDKDTMSEMESSEPELPQDEQSVNLVSKNLIQDCMWSGPCLAAAGLISLDKSKKDSQKCDSDQSSACTEISSGQCVDPTAVFPYQLETIKKLEKTTFNLGSIAETPSPSESEDEEEIDVVTVVAEKMARRRHAGPPKTITSNSLHSHLAAIHNYSSTSSPPPHHGTSYSAPQSPQSSHQKENLHNYAGHKRSRPLSMPASPQPAKKQRSLLQSTDLKHVAQKLKMNQHSNSSSTSHGRISRPSSDSEGEDVNKRAQHNVLERKRRNDLKYSFLRLRDNVPELSKQDRSPKVTILKLSSDFVRSLTSKNRRLESEHARLKAHHERLLQKLSALRRECL